jgi:ABC-type multidrug transport system permease subunit
MLVYLMCVRGFVTLLTYVFPSRYLSMGLVGLATTATSLVAGFSLHHDDIPIWLFWLRCVNRVGMSTIKLRKPFCFVSQVLLPQVMLLFSWKYSMLKI